LSEPIRKRIARWLYKTRRILATIAGVSAIWIIGPTVFTNLLSSLSTTQATSNIDVACSSYPQPASGLYASYDPSERVAPFTIKTSVGGHYYVKLEDAVTARPVIAFFLRGGETFQHTVPAGSFVLKYATGDVWCGERDLFGSTTSTNQADRVFEFSETYGYTIELIARKGGNLPTRTIDRNRF
jgi:hypothetical protein